MLGLNVFAAETTEEAQLLFTSLQQAFVNLRTGHPGQLPPPLPDYDKTLEPRRADMLERVLRCAIVGDRGEIADGLNRFIAAHAQMKSWSLPRFLILSHGNGLTKS